MLKIWGRNNSVNVQKVLWACVEAELDFERVDAGREFGLVGETWYLALNPNGLVPVIDDGGFVLWESNVIVRYLTSRYASGGLYPADVETRALAEQWMDWEQTALEPAQRPVFWGLVRTAAEERDGKAIEDAAEALARIWAILDSHLDRNPYVAGEDFTMGDIPLGAAARRWFAFDIERPAMPRLEAWHERIRTREGYLAHVALPLS